MNDKYAEPAALDKRLTDQVLACTGASGIEQAEHVQSLWGGFGQILRIHLKYAVNKASEPADTVIVKQVRPPSQLQHPRGWNTDASVQRKLLSYEVETYWYQHYAGSTYADCAMPRLYDGHTDRLQTTLVLEDLDANFPRRHASLNVDTCVPCLRWLARFHALHLDSNGYGLWPTGSYWHLQTRSDEFKVMAEGELKQAATSLDAKLNGGQYQSLIHGDAKVANMCFSSDGLNVAMVDFQYVGRGCGMRDVAYFLGSCLSNSDCERYADSLLAIYFAELTRLVPAGDREALESEWRALYSTAWADFHRFLAGWTPEHHKINAYMQRMTSDALANL